MGHRRYEGNQLVQLGKVDGSSRRGLVSLSDPGASLAARAKAHDSGLMHSRILPHDPVTETAAEIPRARGLAVRFET